MRHLVCNSVYDSCSIKKSAELDGVELLTGFTEIHVDTDGVVAVHLPFSIDWFGAFSGTRKCNPGPSSKFIKYLYYGTDRESIVANIRETVRYAAKLKPEYGVFHACSANFDELFDWRFGNSDSKVVSAVAELMNECVSEFPNCEPPFKILFENLWWPGLRLLDDSGYRMLRDKLEFDNWGICLDTGHLLISMGGAKTESEAIGMLREKFESYPKELIDSICTVHLHVNTSSDEIKSLRTPEGFFDMNDEDRVWLSYSKIASIDRHLPFTDIGIVDVIKLIGPEFINHEMGAVDVAEKLSNYHIQRNLFP